MQKAKRAPGKRIKILIVDDHPLVRQGIENFINQHKDLLTCGQAEDEEEALRLVDQKTPDVVVVDLSLKNSSGYSLIKKLAEIYPSLPILVLSMHEESLHAERSLKLGARGYVMKTDNPARLIEGLRCVSRGKIYLSDEINEQLLLKAVDGKSASTSIADVLTARELEVFELVGRGKKSHDIAAHLGISRKTVDVHRQNIKTKLKLRNSAELIKKAVEYAGLAQWPGS
ncbi:MAG TPA: DNA-binding response regulator [Verrucomicrobia bacterium]|nr:MAG: hypothetical protein A2X46_12420 [Lentisphaerae bacterium GWF2_57_35]HBA84096.1 DNA-binding response regulator [Verrucomicrobiota bacterium]